MTSFKKAPQRKRRNPFSTVRNDGSFGFFSCGRRDFALPMGPARSCGKNETKSA